MDPSQSLLQRAKSRRQPDEAQQLLPTCPMVYAIIDEASLEEAAAANAAANAAAAVAAAAAAAAGGVSAGSPRSTDGSVGGAAVGGGGSVGSAGSLRGLGEGSGRLGSGAGGSGGGGERSSSGGGGLLKRLSSGKSTADGTGTSLDAPDQSGGLLGGKGGAMDFAMLGPAGEGLQKAGVLLQEGGEFNPAMFRMRLPAVEEGTQVKVRVSYVETMGVRAGYYEVVVPLVVPEAVVPSHLELVEVVQVSCAINSGHTRPLKVGDFNHPMKVMFVELGRASFTGFPASTTPDGKPCVWPNADFVLSYQVVCEDVAAAMLVQAPYEEDPDTRAIFCLSVCPPDPCQLPVYGRAVVFILDSHNAMRGRAMEEARRAVMAALKRLSPADSFGIIAFDYELLVFAEAMESATAEAVKKASKFVLQAYDTDEACNILSPLQLALKMLKGVRGMLPQIVLLSDAAVEDERSICCYLQEALLEWGPNAPRIFTCGIGPSCSYYFLRWIAGVSRGATEFAFTADEVRKKVERLLLAVSRPLITNITIRDMPAGFQLVPFPIPDLYAACPVAVSGRLDGDVPLALELRGVRANGAPWKAKVPVVEAATLPLSTVGIREHTDLMTADAWLQRDPDLERGVARMSQTVCVPSHFTRMVLFETNRASYDALQHDRIQVPPPFPSSTPPHSLPFARMPPFLLVFFSLDQSLI
ncbi:unnamed protein product [Closterium sp. Naga37s-1]|nr:unnamed protein product [Closterium sp. Naga37s-1]